MNIRLITRAILILAGAAVLTGCAVGPDYHKPAPLPGNAALPDHFKESVPMRLAHPDAATQNQQGISPQWWRMFGDPILDGLMHQLQASNQNLVIAEAKYRQAISTQQQAWAALWPTLSGNGGYTHGRSKSSTKTTSLHPTDTVTLGVSAQWEVDLWGRLRRGLESVTATTQATAGDLAATRLSLQAQLATSYTTLRMVDAQKALLEATVQDYTKSLKRQQNRYQQGVISRLDLTEASAQLQAAQAQLTNVGVQRASLEHSIAVLIGKAPASFSLPPEKDITLNFPKLPSLLPSTMLERRPDVAAAERRMASANAEIGVAEAAYFPALSLSGSGGYSGSNFGDLMQIPNQIWSLGSSLAVTLFDNGARKALTDSARAAYDQQVASYRQVVLTALQDTEDSLASLRILSEQEQQQQAVVDANQKIVDLTLHQYEAGTVDYLSVMTVRNTLLSARRDLISIRQQKYLAAISLLKALGGGWQGMNAAGKHF